MTSNREKIAIMLRNFKEKTTVPAKKILISWKFYQDLCEEENLWVWVCPTCNKMYQDSKTICHEGVSLIRREAPIVTMFGLPFEVSSNIKEIEVI